MKPRIATALRAHFVLFSVSAGVAGVVCLGLILLLGIGDVDTPASTYLGGMLLVAVLIMLVLRRRARHAFDAAQRARKVQLHERHGLEEASIADDCAQPWLVQLHLELHGHHCRN
jgi:ABC-type transport system involved in cytochrome bd biosynthesis fused ATPase/permease subunit